MDILLNTIARIKDQDMPFDVSNKILKRIILEKLKIPLVLTGVFLTSFSCLGYRIYNFLATTGGLRVIKVIIVDFQIDWDYFFESWEGFIETMPTPELHMLIINGGLIVALGCYLYRSYWSHSKILA